jgi:hypothetical protein
VKKGHSDYRHLSEMGTGTRCTTPVPVSSPALANAIEVRRSDYQFNDRRAAVKRLINDGLGSRYVEEKSYTPLEGLKNVNAHKA